MADLESIILLIIAILLLALFLYIGDRLFGNKKVELTSSYYLKAIITAIVIFALIIGVTAVLGVIDVFGIGQIAPILTFVVAIYAIRGLLLSSADYERAVWVGIVAWILVYVVDYIASTYFSTQLIEFI